MFIGLVGKKGCGKGTAADYLVKKYGAVKLRFSGVLDDVLERLGLEKSRENEIELALGLRDRFGVAVIAGALAKDFKKGKEKIRILDGIRYWEELEKFKDIPGFILVYFDVPLKKRYERNSKRAEKTDDNVSLEEFKKMEKAPTEIYIEEIGKKADVIIDNSGSIEDLYKEIDEKIGKKINED